MIARLPAPPLFLQALGLVIATLLATLVTSTMVLLSLPPPVPDAYRLNEVI